MKILIADRDWIVRDSISQVVLEISPSAEISQATDRATLLNALAANPDISITIIDDSIVANDEDGLFARIRKLAPDAAIGLLSASIDRERMLKTIYFGAVAIILKHEDREQVSHAIGLLLGGHVAFPRHILARGPTDKPSTMPIAFDKRVAEDNLTPREREVIGMIGQGRTVANIALSLALSPHTVRVHVTRIMKKLDLRDRPALMHYAVIRSQATERASETAH